MMARGTRVVSFVALTALAACTPRAPKAGSVSPPRGPFVAHPLEGPFATLDAYCAMASKRDEWGPDRHCRANGPVASAPHTSARVFFIDDLLTGTSPVASCGLAITTDAGTFVDAPKTDETCNGLLGPDHDVHTDVEELAWKDGHLQLRVVETFRSWSPKSGKMSPPMTRARLILCVSPVSGAPRCTPPIDVGCSDFQGDHVLTWSLENNVLHITDGTAKHARDCEALATGDFVLW